MYLLIIMYDYKFMNNKFMNSSVFQTNFYSDGKLNHYSDNKYSNKDKSITNNSDGLIERNVIPLIPLVEFQTCIHYLKKKLEAPYGTR